MDLEKLKKDFIKEEKKEDSLVGLCLFITLFFLILGILAVVSADSSSTFESVFRLTVGIITVFFSFVLGLGFLFLLFEQGHLDFDRTRMIKFIEFCINFFEKKLENLKNCFKEGRAGEIRCKFFEANDVIQGWETEIQKVKAVLKTTEGERRKVLEQELEFFVRKKMEVEVVRVGMKEVIKLLDDAEGKFNQANLTIQTRIGELEGEKRILILSRQTDELSEYAQKQIYDDILIVLKRAEGIISEITNLQEKILSIEKEVYLLSERSAEHIADKIVLAEEEVRKEMEAILGKL